MKISFKITLLSLFIVFFTSGLYFYFANTESKNTLQKQVLQKLKTQSSFIVNSIDHFLYERLNDMQNIASDPILSDLKSSTEIIDNRLNKLVSSNDLYYSMSFFNMDRVRLADSKNLSVGKKHSLSKYWLQVNDSTDLVMDISKSESVGEIVIHFGSIVRNNANQPIGLVISRVLISRLYEVFDDVSKSDSFSNEVDIDIFEKKGRLLYSNHHPDKVLVENYSNASILSYFQNSDDFSFLSDDRIYFYKQEEGYLNFKGNGWGMIMSVPKELAFSSVFQLQKQLTIAMVPIVLVATFLALFASKKMTKKLSVLSDATDKLGEGNLQTQISIKSVDEIGRLARNFNKMANRLRIKVEEQENMYRQLNALNETIEKKNKDITSSINYAKRIQKSMLPNSEQLYSYFPESFILYQPKDIVSGDFYWYDKVKKDGKEYIVVASADCTGHGVPGGFMSMLGSILLTSTVSFENEVVPSQILTQVNRGINVELHQEESRDNIQDGMDISLLTFDLENNQVVFSGAKQNLIIIRDGDMNVIKGDKVSVGGVNNYFKKGLIPFHITDHSFKIKKGDMLYLYSDGYKDQIGGENMKKFSVRQFRELIYDIHPLPIKEQKAILKQKQKEWQREEGKQTDDILVMGIRI